MSYELICRSTVSLGDSQSHVAQEFIHSDVSLGGELRREFVGDHQEEAVSQDLQEQEPFY